MFIKVIFLSVCFAFLLNPIGAQAQTACPADENRFGVVEQLTWRFLYSAENMPTALELMQAASGGYRLGTGELVVEGYAAAAWGVRFQPV
jgi:hypothetical protein